MRRSAGVTFGRRVCMGVEAGLLELLSIDSGSKAVSSRENSRLEFKKTFNLGSAPRYLRTMASFSNARGGYLVFGVTDSPRIAIGVNRRKFESFDPVRLTALLNSNLSPELEWESGVVTVEGVDLGYIYTGEATRKTVIASSNYGEDLREGEIYYRYRGQSRTIAFPELRQIIEERLDREREAWRRHIERIAAAGPTNVGILDSVAGLVHGRGGTYLLDPGLLSQLTFIREGSFDEVDGAPALKIIGSVQPAGAVHPARAVPIAIHFDEIVNSFLGDRGMSPQEGRAFLEQAFREDSYYQPIHFLRRKAGIPVDEALSLLSGLHLPEGHGEKLERRLRGTDVVDGLGAVSDPLPPCCARGGLGSTIEQLDGSAKNVRSLLVRALSEDPVVVLDGLDEVEPRRVFEAITCMEPQFLVKNEKVIRSILSNIFLDRFYELASPDRTYFRKAICRLDEALYADPTD
ncbi:MAG: ATP-binding protein [Longimicrobiales bacterium]